MNKKYDCLLFLCFALLIPGCKQDNTHNQAQSDATNTLPSDSQQIKKVVETIIFADNEGDLEGVLACYSDNAILMPPNDPMIKGKTEIRKRYEGIFATTTMRLENITEEAHVSGDWGLIRGRTIGVITAIDSGEKKSIKDKYLMILRLGQTGDWKISHLMWSPAFE